MKRRNIIIKILLGLLSIPIVIFCILYALEELIHIDNVVHLDWPPHLACFIAYFIGGIILRKEDVKFTPILLIPFYLFIPMGFGDVLISLLLYSISALVVTRTNIKRLYKILILTPVLGWFLFCLFSQPFILNHYEMIDVNGHKVKAQTHQVVIWNNETDDIEQLSELSLLDYDGNIVYLNNYKGKKVFITFWATWCGPCVSDKPQLEIIKEELYNNPDIVFIDVSLDEDIGKWRDYVRHKKPNGIQLIINENAKKFYRAFKCSGIPFGVIIESNGSFTASNLYRPGGINIIETMNNLN